MERERIYEHDGHWLVRRPDTDKFYIAWWPGGTGCRRIRRKATGTADLERAKRLLIAFAASGSGANQGPIPAVLPAPGRRGVAASGLKASEPVLLGLLCDYVERLRGRPSYRTAVPALGIWTEFFALLDVVGVSDLTLEVQERFVAWRRERIRALGQPGSNGTLIRELGLLKAALRDAWKRGRLAAVPYVMSLPSPPPRDRFLTVEEVRRLLAECRQPHLRLFVLMALHTLQRPCAILGLRTSQVDLVNGRIDFLPPGAIQSKKRKPIVPITATLKPELEAAVAQSVSGYVVEWDREPVSSIRTTFQKACTRAGLVGVSPYVLRHTGPTLLAAAGVPLRQIAGMLGHSNDRTTEIYAKHRPEFLQEATRKLDQLFGEPAGVSAPTCAPVRSGDQLGDRDIWERPSVLREEAVLSIVSAIG